MVPSFMVRRFGEASAKLIFYGGLVLLLLLAGLLIYTTGRSDGKRGEVVDRLESENETLEQVGGANESAAETRVKDAVRLEREEKELRDALQATTDSDRQRAIRGCVILRQQGRDTSRIPACTRPEG